MMKFFSTLKFFVQNVLFCFLQKMMQMDDDVFERKQSNFLFMMILLLFYFSAETVEFEKINGS